MQRLGPHAQTRDPVRPFDAIHCDNDELMHCYAKQPHETIGCNDADSPGDTCLSVENRSFGTGSTAACASGSVRSASARLGRVGKHGSTTLTPTKLEAEASRMTCVRELRGTGVFASGHFHNTVTYQFLHANLMRVIQESWIVGQSVRGHWNVRRSSEAACTQPHSLRPPANLSSFDFGLHVPGFRMGVRAFCPSLIDRAHRPVTDLYRLAVHTALSPRDISVIES